MGHGLKAKTHTTDQDLGWREIEKQVAVLRKNPYVMVGVQEGAGSKSSRKNKSKKGGKSEAATTVALVASAMEFGAKGGKIPERSFIRSTMDESHGELNEMTDGLIDQILDGATTVEKALKIIGLSIVSRIKRKIQTITEPPLAASTIKAKGSDKPLIDTSQLLNSIQSKMVLENSGFSDAVEAAGEVDSD